MNEPLPLPSRSRDFRTSVMQTFKSQSRERERNWERTDSADGGPCAHLSVWAQAAIRLLPAPDQNEGRPEERMFE